jgi:hypothetical protein
MTFEDHDDDWWWTYIHSAARHINTTNRVVPFWKLEVFHRYGELSAANFHFMLPYCLFNSSYQVQDQQWNRNRLSEPVANFTEGDRLEWTAAERWLLRNNLNTTYPVASCSTNGYPVAEPPGLGSEKPPWSKLILSYHFARAHNLRDRNTRWKYTALLSSTHDRYRSVSQ